MPRATPNDPIPDRTKMVQLLDFDKHHVQPHSLKETEYGEMCFFKLPMDFPGFMRILRRVDNIKTGRKATVIDHLATTLEITMSDGRRIWLKWDRKKNKLTISTQAENDEKPTKVVTY